MSLYIGIDVGTSGVRAIVIDEESRVVAEQSDSMPLPDNPAPGCHEQDPAIWWRTVQRLLKSLLARLPVDDVHAICVDGTSSTLLVCDDKGQALAPALMYNDSRSREAATLIERYAPAESAATGPGSSLAKLLTLSASNPQASHALHQCDWISGQLSGLFGHSDENNCLKMGYEPGSTAWPQWISNLGFDHDLLPVVHAPGTVIGTIDSKVAKQLGFSRQVRIVSGTTDSTAAFIATGARSPGEAVTSLGSTLVTKVIAEQPVFARHYGVYSHRIFDRWLVGGASNSGGAALLKCFSIEEMAELTPLLDPQHDTGLDYYPLTGIGERFPIARPDMLPRMPDKLPTDRQQRARIFQGLLEGISHIEAEAYHLLHELGAPYPQRLFTVGGGAVNRAWSRIRQRYLGIEPQRVQHDQAAYGAALLARHGWRSSLSSD